MSWRLQKLIKEGKLAQLQQMYKEWPFFSVTLDMIEMVFAKADPRVAQVCFLLSAWLGYHHQGTGLLDNSEPIC